MATNYPTVSLASCSTPIQSNVNVVSMRIYTSVTANAIGCRPYLTVVYYLLHSWISLHTSEDNAGSLSSDMVVNGATFRVKASLSTSSNVSANVHRGYSAISLSQEGSQCRGSWLRLSGATRTDCVQTVAAPCDVFSQKTNQNDYQKLHSNRLIDQMKPSSCDI